MPRKVILDVDTGSDDAVALLTAILSPDLELVAACTVWGNKEIDKTTDNTLRLLDAMDVEVPVYKGCDTAMVKYLAQNRIKQRPFTPVFKDGKEVQMHTDSLPIPPARSKEQDMPAACFYVDYLRKATEPVTLIPVGPLTNVGLALRIAPDIVSKIDEIIIMGGGKHFSNVHICGEGNIWHDPEAAQIIVDSGAKVTFVPLDATHRACLTFDDCERLRALGTFAGDFAADQIEQRILVHNATQPLETPNGGAVHDALAVCAAIDPTVLQDVRYIHCEIGLMGYGEGQTIVEGRHLGDEPNVYFAFNGDRQKFSDMLCDIFARDSHRSNK